MLLLEFLIQAFIFFAKRCRAIRSAGDGVSFSSICEIFFSNPDRESRDSPLLRWATASFDLAVDILAGEKCYDSPASIRFEGPKNVEA